MSYSDVRIAERRGAALRDFTKCVKGIVCEDVTFRCWTEDAPGELSIKRPCELRPPQRAEGAVLMDGKDA